jgi:hypothetical protein
MSAERLSLDVIQIDAPCPASWDAMRGDERVRYCEGCHKHVFNLSAMTRTEAERVVCDHAGGLCVRFARTDDGKVQTLDYRPPAGRPRGWRFWTVLSTCAAALVAGVNGYVLARGRPPAALPAAMTNLGRVRQPVIMGGVCPPASSPAVPPPQSQPPPALPPA